MTIQELIDKLKTFPPETLVVVRGYEEGYNDISILKEISLELDANEEWYYGQHTISKDSNAPKAIVLLGENKNATEKVSLPEW